MKKFVKFITLGVTIVSLTACSFGKKQEAQVEVTREDSTDVTENAEISDKITITDSMGTIEVNKNIKKAVVFDMSVLETIDTFEIDGLEIAAPLERLPRYLSKYETLAVSAGTTKEPNFEAIFEFEPEIIIISGRQEAFYNQLSQIAPTWFVAQSGNPEPIKTFETVTTYLGDIFDKQDKAKELIENINLRVVNIQEKTSNMKEKALVILTNDGKISAYGGGSRFGIIHDSLNIPSADLDIESSTHGQEVGFEYISKINPDILFVVDRTKVAGGEIDATKTLDNDLVKGTNAYKNGKIVELDAESWYSSGSGAISLEIMLNEIENILQN